MAWPELPIASAGRPVLRSGLALGVLLSLVASARFDPHALWQDGGPPSRPRA